MSRVPHIAAAARSLLRQRRVLTAVAGDEPVAPCLGVVGPLGLPFGGIGIGLVAGTGDAPAQLLGREVPSLTLNRLGRA